VPEAEAQLTNLLRFLSTEKSTVITRMQTSFNWAFGILTIFAVGVSTRPGFPESHLSFFLLIAALVLLTQFFVRTSKDYVNQMRFAALEKVCLGCLFALKVDGADPHIKEVGAKFDQYFIQWKSPIRLPNVIKKTLFDHGYFALYIIVLTLLVWVGVKMDWNDYRPILTLVVGVVVVVIIVHDFWGFYFQCDREEESMKGKD
jgi:hypothetical protein